jgi:hypothetical protein
MRDAEARGEGNTVLRREIRYLEEAFGLTPASPARLRWRIGAEAVVRSLPDGSAE